ncbi:MAG: YibE/F family protein [Oscillospiraceae bacterium]|nr:YibE/F family protein [Oscillospiraceae bacterium]
MKRKSIIIYVIILAASATFLFLGNRWASDDVDMGEDIYAQTFYSAVVTEIVDRGEVDDFGFFFSYIIFNARITQGERRGEYVEAEQAFFEILAQDEREVQVGNRVLLFYDDWSSEYIFANFVRINYIVILGIAFLALVILFGRMKGFNAIVALGFTCMAIFLVFIPAILSGRNIYVLTIIICIYAIVSTLLMVLGFNRKALSSMLGCFCGVLLAGALMFLMDMILGLTGAADQEMRMLLFLPTENPINLSAIIFAGIILGAVGGIMDVSMSIASALWEVKETGGVSDFKILLKSGITIGRDILGAQISTLVLAYIGSSISLILLITAHSTSHTELFNMEMILIEFLRALIGSFGMLLAIPMTAGICGWLYTAIKDDDEPDTTAEPDSTAEFAKHMSPSD